MHSERGSMKKLSCCLLIVLVCSVFAQEDDDPKVSIYRIFLDRVYEHTKGYVVTYGDLHDYRNELALPISWFGSTYSSFAYIHTFAGNHSPFMELYFLDGELDKIHLYLPSNPLHSARRTLRNIPEIQNIFNVEPTDLLF